MLIPFYRATFFRIPEVSICKLCLKEKKLIKRSHLFPNFMYKGIADKKNRMFEISTLTPFQRRVVQSGVYEGNILCADCDNNILSKLEGYVNNYLYSKPYQTTTENFEQVTNTYGIQVIRCKNIDYPKFKLFLESLIWRASVSTHPLFNNFKLSTEQEEQLRVSILISDPLGEDDFACIISTHHNKEEVQTDLVFVNSTVPRKVSFFINQFTYLFHLDKKDVDENTRGIILTKRNEMGILKLPYGDWTKLRASVISDIADLAKKTKRSNLPSR